MGMVGCVRSIPVRRGGRRARSGACGPFQSALGNVWFVRVLSAHSRCTLRVVGCVRSIHMSSRGRQVHLGAFDPFQCALRVVGCGWSIPARPGGCQVSSISVRPGVSSGAFGPFSCSMRGIGFVRVRLVHSIVPCGSFGCVRSIPVRPGDRRVRSVQFRTP